MALASAGRAGAAAPPRRRPSRAQGLLLCLLLLLSLNAVASASFGRTPGPHRIRAVGFLPPCSWSASASTRSSSSSSTSTNAVVVWGRKRKPQQGSGDDEEEDAELLATMGGRRKGKKKGTGSRSSSRSAPRPPVFTARIVLLGSPSPEWGADMRARLLEEGWMEDRVQVLPLPDPKAKEYPEAKWIAYMREGIMLRNSTFVIGADPQSSTQVLRFLEKHPLRGAILFAPPDQYTLGGDDEPSRTWDHGAVKRHCPFIGLVYPMPTAHAGDDGWSPPPEAEAVREGLGLAPYPFGIRAPAVGQEHKAVQALIRDWQFLETLGMGPIQLVGGDDEEEEAARREQPGEGADEEGD